MTLLHELVHYGDYLDGIQQLGGEAGRAFEWDVWWLDSDGSEYVPLDKYNPATQKGIIEEKQDDGAIPTLPEYPGSAGSADQNREKYPNPNKDK